MHLEVASEAVEASVGVVADSQAAEAKDARLIRIFTQTIPGLTSSRAAERAQGQIPTNLRVVDLGPITMLHPASKSWRPM